MPHMSNYELWIGDTDPRALAFTHTSNKFLLVPTLDENLDEIIDILKNNSINYVIPTRDGELEFWAKNKKVFELHNIIIIGSPLSAINICNDKLLFFKYLSKLGFPVIPTSEATSEISNSYVVKERFGSGSKNIGLGLDESSAKEFAKTLQDPIFQPLIFGDEFSVDVWASNSTNHFFALPRLRKYVLRGESKITTIFRDRRLEELAISIVQKIGIKGICVLQGIKDSNDSFHIIECNPRIGGATTASAYAGFPIFELLLRDYCDLSLQIASTEFVINPISQIRYEIDRLVNDSGF